MHFSFVLQGWEIQKCGGSRSQVALPVWSAHCGAGLVPPPFLFVATPYDALAWKIAARKEAAPGPSGYLGVMVISTGSTAHKTKQEHHWMGVPANGRPWWENPHQKVVRVLLPPAEPGPAPSRIYRRTSLSSLLASRPGGGCPPIYWWFVSRLWSHNGKAKVCCDLTSRRTGTRLQNPEIEFAARLESGATSQPRLFRRA
jgi:hypothetical protein